MDVIGNVHGIMEVAVDAVIMNVMGELMKLIVVIAKKPSHPLVLDLEM